MPHRARPERQAGLPRWLPSRNSSNTLQGLRKPRSAARCRDCTLTVREAHIALIWVKPCDLLSAQSPGMPAQMIFHEGGDEIIGMVVAFLHAQGEGDVRALARLCETPGPQPVLEKSVGAALIDEKLAKPGAVL